MRDIAASPQISGATAPGLVQAVSNGVAGLKCPVHVYPGENEMFALAKGALRVLNGKERAHEYPPEAR